MIKVHSANISARNKMELGIEHIHKMADCHHNNKQSS
jgi:hypothetical protein